ncbi:hypothetical protein [Metabacillus fastidiosus]|uniref:hypothetical protein n=1 Tax=Metabacillus fastidiosus TaxID=1458 RepID=UPI003D26B5AB
MNKIDPVVKLKAEQIIYHVQTNEGIHLSDKSRHDIYCNVNDVAEYWKEGYDTTSEYNNDNKFEELRLWIKHNEPTDYNDILSAMLALDNKEYIRNLKVRK